MNRVVNTGILVVLAWSLFIYGLPWAADADLVWSTFLGGSGADYGYDIAIDSSGRIWVTGFTESVDFPATTGAFDTTAGDRDAFVASLDPTGSELLLATFLGGENWEEGFGLALDDAGSAYVTGYTRSADFPVTAGAVDSTVGGITDAFVVKLAPGGESFCYATLLGGSEDEQGYAIAVDDSGRASVVGITDSDDFPTTPGAFQQTCNGQLDAFVVRLDQTGTALEYATFLGGNNSDYGWDIVLNGSDSVYVTGYTYSSDFPTTAGAFDTTFGGPTDVFMARLDLAGGDLLYSTFLGGSFYDAARSIATDAEGHVYVTGYTKSLDFPTTPGSLDTTISIFDTDGFVTKFSPDGSVLSYSTYLGGDGDDSGYGVILDDSGRACVIGFTESADFPTTCGAFDETINGERDVFVAVLNPTGSALDYATFLGGSEDDYGWNLILDGSDEICLVGYTRSADFPVAGGAFQDSLCGGEDVIVARFFPGGTPVESETIVAVLPEGCALGQNYPNPFNATTRIEYQTPLGGHTTLEIFNASGQRVRTLVDGEQPAGQNTITWDGWDDGGRQVASGVYFCRLQTNHFQETIKMMLVR
ncbi:SBBP repeat-containing protein [bacterium]|nr:SBBP repeat-containing protein [bacterium]